MAPSPFMDALSRHMLAHHYGKRTVDSYLYWIRFYIRFHSKRHPQEMGSSDVMAFLSFLANERHVSVATQKIALNALAYLYNKYLGKPFGELGYFNKASRQRKLPVVLTRVEVGALLGKLRGSPWLLASTIYTCLSYEPGTENLRRHHVDESSINKLVKRVA